MQTFAKDLRLAVRLLVKRPGFTAVAVLTLALGIALNATIFSLVSAFLLRRPPVHDATRIVAVSSVNPNPVFLPDAYLVSAPNYLAWSKANHVFSQVAAVDPFRTVSLTEQGQPEALLSGAVTPNYFSVLGVTPQLGRTFSEGEDQPGRDHVVILSHDLWERRFGSDPAIVGRTIRVNREDYTVAGVMPANFRMMGFTEKLWTPLVLSAADQTEAARKDHSLYLFARLKPGVTLEQASAELTTLARRTEKDFPETEKSWGARVRTLPDFLVYNFSIRNGLAVMMTAVCFVLLIACSNVAGLLLARAAGRKKELAIRISLGASRRSIIQQLLTEGLLLALLGGSAGLLLSYWGIKFVRSNMNFNDAISAVPLSLDLNVLLFTVAVSLGSAVLCGLAPALKASRTDINASLKDESRAASAGRSHHRLRTVLVTAEIALALLLLVGTGLLVRGLYLLTHQNLGFSPDHLLTANVTLDKTRYKEASQQARFAEDMLPRLQQIPGVGAAAISSDLPANGPGSVTFLVKGQPSPENQRPTTIDVVVTPDYFRTAGIPLLRGRIFAETDSAGAPPVVVVSQEFVHRFLKDQEPLGKQIRLDVVGATPEWSEIVGVVANVKTFFEGVREDPAVYEAFLERPVNSFSLMLRTNSDPAAVTSAMRSAVAQVDADLPLDRVMSMAALIERQEHGDSFFAQVLGSFGILALLLSAIGIYGLIAYSVGQRTHEIGIRMALGAGRADVLWMVLREGLGMAAIGGAIGLAMALPLPKVFEAMFYDIRLGGPGLYFIVPAAISIVALLATYIPARRATRVDPMSALHQD
jgi:putative ABC transport system permease protein